MALSILNVAYPLAPVSRDAVGGAEQIVAALDEGLVRAGHRSWVLGREDSEIAGTLLPVPAFQVEPPFRLYSHVPPASRPLTLTTLSFVISSLLLLPVSLLSAIVGVATVEASTH